MKPLRVKLMKRTTCLLLVLIAFVYVVEAAAVDIEKPVRETEAKEEIIVPSFGSGKIDVRLYSDYFCEWCKLGAEFDQTLIELVAKNVITVTFVDKPTRPATPLYVRYFFYALRNRMEFDQALRVRKALYDAAWAGIKKEDKLEDYLRQHKVTLTKFDATVSMKNLNKYIKEDNVRFIPTCVIRNGQEKEVWRGFGPITRAVSALKGDGKQRLDNK
ncbi:MAG TPA: hypothetical protein PLX02_02690 [Syntrophorhabdaceae bacterium]|nr:hypothetical protein [Syntrophorhabdaceae bacterium]